MIELTAPELHDCRIIQRERGGRIIASCFCDGQREPEHVDRYIGVTSEQMSARTLPQHGTCGICWRRGLTDARQGRPAEGMDLRSFAAYECFPRLSNERLGREVFC